MYSYKEILKTIDFNKATKRFVTPNHQHQINERRNEK